MKTVYEASSGLEAHMILNLLLQEGCEARVDGEFLQGGIGELQTLNLVRVRVSDADFEAARAIIAEWEARQPESDAVHPPRRRSSATALGFILGVVAGAAGMHWVYHAPLSRAGLAFDLDESLDGRRLQGSQHPARTTHDRDGDGRPDLQRHFDRSGLLWRSDADQDFDGVYETRDHYANGVRRLREADVDGDGAVDFRAHFRHGVLTETEILDPDNGLARKRQRYCKGKRVASGYDADGDGIMDVERVYDFFEEPRWAVPGELSGPGQLAPTLHCDSRAMPR
jgi:hypothetical protein